MDVAQKFLAGKAWSSETVLRMGVDLLSAANLLPSIPFQDKVSLVCQTILRMLDGVEKVGKEHSLESIAIMPTTAQLEEYKNLVKMLPVILDFVNTRQSLPQAQCVPLLSNMCLPLGGFSWGCVRKQVAESVTAVEDVLKNPQAYLEEMRGLVSKMEKLVSSPQAVAAMLPSPLPLPLPEPVPLASATPEPIPQAISEISLSVAESLLEPRSLLPPNSVLSDESLPGGLVIRQEAEPSQ